MPNISNGGSLSRNIDDFKLDNELRDIKNYHGIELPDWACYIIITTILIVIFWLIYTYIKNRKKEKPLTLLELTLKRLSGLETNLSPKIFYLKFSEILKTYLDERLKLSTIDKTVEEMKEVLDKVLFLETSQALSLMKIMNRADLAKFAKEAISVEQKLGDIAITKEIINSIESKLNQGEELDGIR
jgi:hypothetical protein